MINYRGCSSELSDPEQMLITNKRVLQLLIGQLGFGWTLDKSTVD